MRTRLAITVSGTPLLFLTPLVLTLVVHAGETPAQYTGWAHSGSFFILTTPEGADLPAAASEDGFPLLVRLDKDFFDYKQAQAQGEDIRFAACSGAPLAYQIDEWNAAAGTACIWVRIPTIKGNAHQEIRMFWGKAGAKSESNGAAVFNSSNGYLAVWHMDDTDKDEAGGLETKDQGTTSSTGVIGKSRHFIPGTGINCGEQITTFPAKSNPHSTEIWFKCDKQADRILCWGNGEPKTMVQIMAGKPLHAIVDCYGPAGVQGKSAFPLNQWVHVFHTYEKNKSRVYVNGRLDGLVTSHDIPFVLKSPVQMFMGGWRGYTFSGEIDEVRVSKAARSANWVKLQYENQKPLQTVVGPLVQPGSAFSVSEKKIILLEGQHISVTAQAGGAEKVAWILKEDGRETVAAMDRFAFTFEAGRVTGDKALILQFKAVYANTVKTLDIPVTIQENIPDPIFTLKAPERWDGRKPIEVLAQFANLSAMQAQGAGKLNYHWTVSGMAVIKEPAPGKLLLKRAHNSGTLTATATVDNGGKPATQSVSMVVKEPGKDTWVERTPDKDEKPVDNQFYARDDKNEGRLYYNGTLSTAADSVFLKLYADDKLIKTETQKPGADKAYAFSVKLQPGLIKYKVEFGVKNGNVEKVQHTATGLVCGDAYIIDGQSNAVAYNYENDTKHPEITKYTSTWIRSYGGNGEAGDPTGGGWGEGVIERLTPTSPDRVHFIGSWGMALARKLVEDQRIPICIFNGAVGGTRIDQHLPDPADHLNTSNEEHSIYRNLLKRIVAARLTHGIRGVMWHQGEADQGFDGPDNCYGCETYQQYFENLSGAWKQDYPNIQHYYLFQIWPNACLQGGNRHSDILREVQRRLSHLYSNLGVMSTLSLPTGGCHFLQADYEKMGLALALLVERDDYGRVFDKSVAAPDLKKACYTSDKQGEIALEFDQPMVWSDALTSQFYPDGEAGKIASGSGSGNVIKLKLAAATAAQTITYLVDRKWDCKNVLYGANGIAALTFCEAPIAKAKESVQ